MTIPYMEQLKFVYLESNRYIGKFVLKNDAAHNLSFNSPIYLTHCKKNWIQWARVIKSN